MHREPRLARLAPPAVLVMLALLAVVAVAPAATPEPPPGFALNGDAARGKAAYAKRCALCHGPSGHGDGTLKTDPPPRDFRDPRVAERTDWELYLVIRDGGKAIGLSSKMLAWKGILSDQEVRDTAAFVRALAEEGESGG